MISSWQPCLLLCECACFVFPCLYYSSCVSPHVCSMYVFMWAWFSFHRQCQVNPLHWSTSCIATGFPAAHRQIVSSVYVVVCMLAPMYFAFVPCVLACVANITVFFPPRLRLLCSLMFCFLPACLWTCLPVASSPVFPLCVSMPERQTSLHRATVPLSPYSGRRITTPSPSLSLVTSQTTSGSLPCTCLHMNIKKACYLLWICCPDHVFGSKEYTNHNKLIQGLHQYLYLSGLAGLPGM